jgi:hypothetical protein
MNIVLSLSDILTMIAFTVSIFFLLFLGLIKLAQLEAKVDTLWQFQLRRGEVEAVLQGYATKNSPIRVNEERASQVFPAGLAEEIQRFFNRLGRNLTRVEMAAEIERHFGDRIVDEVCIPQGISQGTCLILALHFASGQGQQAA